MSLMLGLWPWPDGMTYHGLTAVGEISGQNSACFQRVSVVCFPDHRIQGCTTKPNSHAVKRMRMKGSYSKDRSSIGEPWKYRLV